MTQCCFVRSPPFSFLCIGESENSRVFRAIEVHSAHIKHVQQALITAVSETKRTNMKSYCTWEYKIGEEVIYLLSKEDKKCESM